MSLDWHPEDPATLADPYPVYARLRDEDPCHWSPRLKGWVLTRYDDVRRACHDRERYSSDRLRPFFGAMPADEAARIADIIRYLSLWMVFKDPPEHTRLRRLAGKVFTARAMQGMRPEITAITAHLLEGLAGRERFDFIAEFAGPLPCLVIMSMLGVPHSDLALLKRLSDDIAPFIGSARTSALKYAAAQTATREMADYFRELIALRRRREHTDLLAGLVAVRDGEDRLSEDELVATCILMLFAGHETTTNHLANGLAALMRFPDQLAALRDDPALAPAAVEELLRYEGPSGAQARVVAQAHELHGRALREGDRVFLLLNAANRDPRAYADPERVDLRREGVPHLAFGYGPHICLGFPLARTEGEVALPAVLRRFARIEPADPPPRWLNSLVFRGMDALTVQVRPS